MKKETIITRRVKIFVAEKDPELKKGYIHTLYEWRNALRKAANIIVTHKYCQNNIKDFIYLTDDAKKQFYIPDILKKGKGCSVQNTTYRICSKMLKGKIPSEFYSNLNRQVCATFTKLYPEVSMGKRALPNYKNNLPISFRSDNLLSTMKWDEETKRYYFKVAGIPFATILGADRSNNKVIIDRCLSNEYKLCTSSIMIDDNKRATYLYICAKIPTMKMDLDKDKTCYATLGVMYPITAQVEGETWLYHIGTADEYLYRRRQIQELYKRIQVGARYNKGGKGRAKKMEALDRCTNLEKNYIHTKMHQYSRKLVDYAIKNKCGKIHLLMTDKNEERNNKDELLIRNWNYSELLGLIKYKCEMSGIILTQDKDETTEQEYFSLDD